jgi:hypothetical protein
MKLVKVLSIFIAAIIIAGCASTKISTQERQSLKRVSISAFAMPEKPLVYESGTGIGVLLAGPIGVALANAGSDLPTTYKNHLALSKIDIATNLRDEFKSQLKLKGIEVVENGAQADGILNVEVQGYGLTSEVFGANRVPYLQFRTNLAKPNGVVIWKNGALSMIIKEVQKIQGYPITDYFTDAALLEKQLKKVHQITLAEALESL